jgi:hypothetical protein
VSATRQPARPVRATASITVASRTASRRPVLVETDELSREAGVHPELVRALVRLGLLEGAAGTLDAPRFPRDAAARLARAMRLRRDLGLNYAGAVLASELLARIEDLEERLSRFEGAKRRT